MGISCGAGSGLHLGEDLSIIEVVDEDGRPVAPGERSAKVYMTNLYNHTLPLIRYEITDEVTLTPGTCPCGSAHRLIEDPQGRLDESFRPKLVTAGLVGADVRVRAVDHLNRQDTGKLKRFVPSPAGVLQAA